MLSYSLIMPYHHRPDQLHHTLQSLRYWYKNREGVEVVIVEDVDSNAASTHRKALRDVLLDFPDLDLNLQVAARKGISSQHNQGVRAAKHDYVVFNGPEILHYRDALAAYDAFFVNHPNYYAIGSCWCSTFPGKRLSNIDPRHLEAQGFRFRGWYQHGKAHNRQLHFCAALHRDVYDEIGGFCPDFDDGIAYEDDDFIAQARYKNIPIISLDAVETTHQDHPRVDLPNYGEKWERNRKIFVARQQKREKGEL